MTRQNESIGIAKVRKIAHGMVCFTHKWEMVKSFYIKFGIKSYFSVKDEIAVAVR